MATEVYEPPTVTVLGSVSDLTGGKPGIYFDRMKKPPRRIIAAST